MAEPVEVEELHTTMWIYYMNLVLKVNYITIIFGYQSTVFECQLSVYNNNGQNQLTISSTSWNSMSSP